ncbi:5860_t:CDS:2, partial [Rhizophagus irregularis]
QDTTHYKSYSSPKAALEITPKCLIVKILVLVMLSQKNAAIKIIYKKVLLGVDSESEESEESGKTEDLCLSDSD